jgi:hypothetical protein
MLLRGTDFTPDPDATQKHVNRTSLDTRSLYCDEVGYIAAEWPTLITLKSALPDSTAAAAAAINTVTLDCNRVTAFN